MRFTASGGSTASNNVALDGGNGQRGVPSVGGSPGDASSRPGGRGGASLSRSASQLIAATIVTSGAGAAFWLLAAHRYPEGVVGLNSAAIGLASTAALLAGLGTDTAALDLIPRAETAEQRDSMVGALVLVVSLGLLVAFPLMWPLIPHGVTASGSFAHIGLAAAAMLVAAVTTFGLLADSIAVGSASSGWTLTRATSQSIAKLAALAGAAFSISALTWGISAAWGVGSAVALAWSLGRLRAHGDKIRVHRPSRHQVIEVLRLAPHHVGAGTLGQMPMLLAPVVALHLYGASSAAHAYVGWMIAGLAFTVSAAAGRVALSHGAARPHEMTSIMAETLRFSLVAGGIAAVGVAIGAPFALGLFGHGFATADTMVRVMLLALVPDAVTNIWMSRWRVERRLGRVTLMNVVITSTMLVLPFALPRAWGVTALAVAWVAAQSTGCVFIAALAIRERRPQSSAGAAQPV